MYFIQVVIILLEIEEDIEEGNTMLIKHNK
jgi:hypothetical protein